MHRILLGLAAWPRKPTLFQISTLTGAIGIALTAWLFFGGGWNRFAPNKPAGDADPSLADDADLDTVPDLGEPAEALTGAKTNDKDDELTFPARTTASPAKTTRGRTPVGAGSSNPFDDEDVDEDAEPAATASRSHETGGDDEADPDAFLSPRAMSSIKPRSNAAASEAATARRTPAAAKTTADDDGFIVPSRRGAPAARRNTFDDDETLPPSAEDETGTDAAEEAPAGDDEEWPSLSRLRRGTGRTNAPIVNEEDADDADAESPGVQETSGVDETGAADEEAPPARTTPSRTSDDDPFSSLRRRAPAPSPRRSPIVEPAESEPAADENDAAGPEPMPAEDPTADPEPERAPIAPARSLQPQPRTLDRDSFLQVSMKAPPSVTEGGIVTVDYEITNRGPNAATNVVVLNNVPEELKHPVSNDLEYRIPRLAPGETRRTKLVLTAAEVGTTVNRAVVRADGIGPKAVEATIAIVPSRVTLARGAPENWTAGAAGTCSTAVTNLDSTSLRQVTVKETLPRSVRFLSATQGGRYDPSTHSVVWTIAELRSRQTRVLQVTLQPLQAGSFTSQVRVSDDRGECGSASWSAAAGCPAGY